MSNVSHFGSVRVELWAWVHWTRDKPRRYVQIVCQAISYLNSAPSPIYRPLLLALPARVRPTAKHSEFSEITFSFFVCVAP